MESAVGKALMTTVDLLKRRGRSKRCCFQRRRGIQEEDGEKVEDDFGRDRARGVKEVDRGFREGEGYD